MPPLGILKAGALRGSEIINFAEQDVGGNGLERPRLSFKQCRLIRACSWSITNSDFSAFVQMTFSGPPQRGRTAYANAVIDSQVVRDPFNNCRFLSAFPLGATRQPKAGHYVGISFLLLDGSAKGEDH